MFYFFNQIASEGLKHRVFEISLADLQNDEDHAYRKIRLRAEDVQGKNVLTNFWVWYSIFFIFFVLLYSELCFNVNFAFLFSRAWTSLQINWDLLSENGSLWSRHMLTWRQPTVTHWGCSALASQRSVPTRWRGPAMHNLAKSDRYTPNFLHLTCVRFIFGNYDKLFFKFEVFCC